MGQAVLSSSPRRPASPDLIKIERLGKFLEPYRSWSPEDFGLDELRAIQQAIVDYRYTRTKHPDEPVAYTRTGINQIVNRIQKMWTWAVGREIVTQAQANKLLEVRPLRIGRTAARDNLKRSAVTAEEFEAVLSKVTSIVADMMWLTAMRPGEVCRMRPTDLLRDKPECWLYIPGRDVSPVGDHKTAHHQRLKAIPLTASAQKVLLPRPEGKKPEQHLFSPAEALAEMRDRRFADRQTPIHQGNSAGTHVQPHPMIRPGDSYGSNSFAEAVKRGCDRAGVTRFRPYDLRRTAATRIRAEQGKEAAQLILGHTSPDTTAIYLLDEVRETMNVALKLEERCKGGALCPADVR